MWWRVGKIWWLIMIYPSWQKYINQHSPSIRTRPQMKGSLPTNILQGLLYDSSRDCIHVGKKHDPFESICFSKKRYLKKIHRTLNFITNPCVFFVVNLDQHWWCVPMVNLPGNPVNLTPEAFVDLKVYCFCLTFFDRWVQKLSWRRFIFSRNLLLQKGFPCSSLKVKGLDDVFQSTRFVSLDVSVVQQHEANLGPGSELSDLTLVSYQDLIAFTRQRHLVRWLEIWRWQWRKMIWWVQFMVAT